MYISGKGRVGPGCFIFNGNRVDMAIKEYDWSRPVSLDRSQRIPIVIYLNRIKYTLLFHIRLQYETSAFFLSGQAWLADQCLTQFPDFFTRYGFHATFLLYVINAARGYSPFFFVMVRII
jgi:hypothetical protein